MVPVLVMEEHVKGPIVTEFVPQFNAPEHVRAPVDAVPLLVVMEEQLRAPVVAAPVHVRVPGVEIAELDNVPDTLAPDVETLR